MRAAESLFRNEDALYAALVARDPEFEGAFFVGVRTTGVFCRPGCPARTPKRENCEFFTDTRLAMQSGYRPCLRCRPLEPPHAQSGTIRRLVAAVECEPARRWRDSDIEALGLHAGTVRRQFRKRFGMTFVEYARAKRLGTALHTIRSGDTVIEAQLNAGYESGSGFREAFARTLGAAPASARADALQASWLDTPLGPMIVIGDDRAVHAIEFADSKCLDRQLAVLRRRAMAGIVPGAGNAVAAMQKELSDYFRGATMAFRTPLSRGGTAFQNAVWDALLEIPPGETRSYGDIARRIGRPDAQRAVAQANAANPCSIVIPCHRVINTGGAPGGYGGGLPRKLWLLAHEQKLAGGAETFQLR